MVVAGRIARALAVFCVDEVVIYDDSGLPSRPNPDDEDDDNNNNNNNNNAPNATKFYTGETDPCHFLAHVLSYIETPPFMRKVFFPLHQNLRLAGLLASLDIPSHPHMRDQIPWREGMTVADRPSGGKGWVWP